MRALLRRLHPHSDSRVKICSVLDMYPAVFVESGCAMLQHERKARSTVVTYNGRVFESNKLAAQHLIFWAGGTAPAWNSKNYRLGHRHAVNAPYEYRGVGGNATSVLCRTCTVHPVHRGPHLRGLLLGRPPLRPNTSIVVIFCRHRGILLFRGDSSHGERYRNMDV